MSDQFFPKEIESAITNPRTSGLEGIKESKDIAKDIEKLVDGHAPRPTLQEVLREVSARGDCKNVNVETLFKLLDPKAIPTKLFSKSRTDLQDEFRARTWFVEEVLEKNKGVLTENTPVSVALADRLLAFHEAHQTQIMRTEQAYWGTDFSATYTTLKILEPIYRSMPQSVTTKGVLSLVKTAKASYQLKRGGNPWDCDAAVHAIGVAAEANPGVMKDPEVGKALATLYGDLQDRIDAIKGETDRRTACTRKARIEPFQTNQEIIEGILISNKFVKPGVVRGAKGAILSLGKE